MEHPEAVVIDSTPYMLPEVFLMSCRHLSVINGYFT